MDDQCRLLKSKAIIWAEKVRCGKLRRNEAWQALTTTVFKTIEYPLPATTLTMQQCEDIISPILQIGLPTSGICRNISRQVAFSSTKYKGLGLKHPFMTQGIHKLILLLDSTTNLTSSLIRASMDLCAYECGLGANFLRRNFSSYQQCITAGWVSSLWEFTSHYKLVVQRTPDNDVQKGRRIMENLGNISNNQLRLFNYFRLYLNLEFVCELFTNDHKRVRFSV